MTTLDAKFAFISIVDLKPRARILRYYQVCEYLVHFYIDARDNSSRSNSVYYGFYCSNNETELFENFMRTLNSNLTLNCENDVEIDVFTISIP